ncbi:hypothetical protein [Aquimarina hainanensis]|uniref:hypothetical protein n=1 Tax=Aquimarina hainanensis TaxID=1578017 RepID=UPI00362119B9
MEIFSNQKGYDLTPHSAKKSKDTLGNLIPYDQEKKESVTNFYNRSIFKQK